MSLGEGGGGRGQKRKRGMIKGVEMRGCCNEMVEGGMRGLAYLPKTFRVCDNLHILACFSGQTFASRSS